MSDSNGAFHPHLPWPFNLKHHGMKGIPKELDNLYFESHEAKRRSIVEEHQKRKSISEEQKITLKKPETNQKVPVVVAPTKDNERAANKS